MRIRFYCCGKLTISPIQSNMWHGFFPFLTWMQHYPERLWMLAASLCIFLSINQSVDILNLQSHSTFSWFMDRPKPSCVPHLQLFFATFHQEKIFSKCSSNNLIFCGKIYLLQYKLCFLFFIHSQYAICHHEKLIKMTPVERDVTLWIENRIHPLP